jgi:hypothetical protein
MGARGQHKGSVLVKINTAIFATQFVLCCGEGVELTAEISTCPDRDYPLNEDRGCEDTTPQREGRMRNLSWRVKLNRTRDRLIALSKQPEFHSMDLARIHPIIEVLAQGSYWVESLSDDLSTNTTKSYAEQPCFVIPFEEGETYFAHPRFDPTTGLVGMTIGVPIDPETFVAEIEKYL